MRQIQGKVLDDERFAHYASAAYSLSFLRCMPNCASVIMDCSTL